ncbi:MAG: MaoC family dehydratase N-terminal domain-containing protein [Selenomonadaceae bacterium]|nr:MaoC family dehydratase N-terminal domain-containing protein [Selenomonadaceae bacterium]
MKFADVEEGKVYPERTFTFREEEIRAYLEAVEDDTTLYVGQKLVPPAFAAVFARWEALADEPLPEGTVHAKQGFRYLKPLHWGDTVTLRGFVKSKMEKKGLKFIERQVEVYDAADDLAVVSEIKIILPE